MPGGYKFAPPVVNQLWQANQPKHACFGLYSPYSFPSRSDILLHAVQASPGCLCSDPFRHETFLPLFRRLATFPLTMTWAAVVYWSALIPKALRSSRRHPIHFFPALHARHKNPMNRVRFLGIITSMLSLLVFMRGVQIANRVVGVIFLSPTDAASQEAVVGSARRVGLLRARVPRDAAVQHCPEYLGSWHPYFELVRGALGRSYTSRLHFGKMHHALRMMSRSTSMDRSASWLTFPPEVYTNSSFVLLDSLPAASTLNMARWPPASPSCVNTHRRPSGSVGTTTVE